MGIGVVCFAIGLKWLLEDVRFLSEFKDMWPVFSAVMVIAWLIHASQLENYAAGSLLGELLGKFTVYETLGLLHLSRVPVNVTGDVLLFGPPSLVDAVHVTPLCGGFLSVVLFIAAFNFVALEVGKPLGWWRLVLLFVVGITVTIATAVMRLFVVILIGFYWGLDALSTAHAYLGYAMFLSVMVVFWYVSLRWSRRHLPSPPK